MRSCLSRMMEEDLTEDDRKDMDGDLKALRALDERGF
mgnify:CR=1 FL=1